MTSEPASRWPPPPYGALAAAIVATQRGRWSDAALLWRDLWRRSRPHVLAASCAAEAALHSGQFGFADHMLAQVPVLPPYLAELVAANERVRRERIAHFAEPQRGDRDDQPCVIQRLLALKLYRIALRTLAVDAEGPECRRLTRKALTGLGKLDDAPMAPAGAGSAVEAFFRSHPLADLADRETARLLAEGFCSLPRGFEATSPETPLPDRASSIPPRRRRIVRRAVAKVRRRLSARKLSGAELARLIVTLDRANVDDSDALMRDAGRRLEQLDAAGKCPPVVVATLYHELGLATFAQTLFRAALTRVDDRVDHRDIRRRLAEIVAARGRLLDHAGVLRPDDFTAEETRAARQALIAHLASRHFDVEQAAAEPLVNAFDVLLDGDRAAVQCYAPENRLLLVGSRLACGGTERLLANTYRHFSADGSFDAVDMALLEFKIGTPSAFFAAEAGVGKRDVLVLDPGGSADLPFSLLPPDWEGRCQLLHDHIVTTRPRVIHAWDEPTGILAAFAGLQAGCPRIVIHFHHCPPAALSRPLDAVASYPAVFRRLVDLPRFEFAFCSNAAARDYAEWWTIRQPPSFHTVYNGYDWTSSRLSKGDARRRLGIPQDAVVIGTVIRFTPVKQPLVWAEAAITLAARLPSAHFLMVGDGWLREQVEEAFATAGIRDRLHLPGEVADVPEHLAAMDLFWLTSRTEGLSIVLVEAQCAGVPVLAFDCGGPRETFIDGETGILIPRDDAEQLADSSARLLRDREWLAQAGHRGRLHAARKFTATGFLDGLRALYDA